MVRSVMEELNNSEISLRHPKMPRRTHDHPLTFRFAPLSHFSCESNFSFFFFFLFSDLAQFHLISFFGVKFSCNFFFFCETWISQARDMKKCAATAAPFRVSYLKVNFWFNHEISELYISGVACAEETLTLLTSKTREIVTLILLISFLNHFFPHSFTDDDRRQEIGSSHTKTRHIFKLAFFCVSVGAKVIKSLGSSRAQFLLKPYRDEWKN